MATIPYTVTCEAAPPDTIQGPVTVTQPKSATLTNDRTVAGGMESLPTTATVAVNVEGSADGINWTLIVGSVWRGGIISGTSHGLPYHTTTDEMDASVDPSQYNRVRVRITPSQAVTLSGTIVTT